MSLKTAVVADWTSRKWSKKRTGRIKFGVSVDPEMIMECAFPVSIDNFHDDTRLSKLITFSESRVYADKA